MNAYTKARNNIIIAMLIFGSVGVFRRYIPFPSGAIALSRSVIGFAFLMLFCLISRRKPDMQAIRKNMPILLASGMLLGINWLTLFEAFNATFVAAASMCYYMAPVFVTIFSALKGEKLSLRKKLCSLAVFAGMILVSGVLETGLYGSRGLMLGLLAALMYASIIILNKALVGISGEDRTLVQLCVSIFALLPYVLLKGELSELTFTPVTALLLLTLGIVHTGMNYRLYFASIADLPAQTAALLSYIDPVTTVILSLSILREPMSVLSFVGCVVVIGSLILSERDNK